MDLEASFFSNSFVLSKPIILGLLVLAIIVWVCMSLILVFHWRHYGMKERYIEIAESIYFFVSAALLVTSLGLFLVI